MARIIGLSPYIVQGLSSGHCSRNRWLEIRHEGKLVGEIYLRIRPHHSDPIQSQLDIANVSMGTKHERRGYFKEVMAQLLAECKRWGVYNMFLENVGNEHLAAWMDRQPGWVRAEDSSWNTPSYNYLVAQEVPA